MALNVMNVFEVEIAYQRDDWPFLKPGEPSIYDGLDIDIPRDTSDRLKMPDPNSEFGKHLQEGLARARVQWEESQQRIREGRPGPFDEEYVPPPPPPRAPRGDGNLLTPERSPEPGSNRLDAAANMQALHRPRRPPSPVGTDAGWLAQLWRQQRREAARTAEIEASRRKSVRLKEKSERLLNQQEKPLDIKDKIVSGRVEKSAVKSQVVASDKRTKKAALKSKVGRRRSGTSD